MLILTFTIFSCVSLVHLDLSLFFHSPLISTKQFANTVNHKNMLLLVSSKYNNYAKGLTDFLLKTKMYLLYKTVLIQF